MKTKIGVQKLLRLAREECGAELVEFAMSAMIILGLTVGIVGMSFGMYTYHFVSTAAQQGARFAMVHGNTWSEYTTEDCTTSAPPNFTMVYDCTASGTDIQNYVQSLATGGITASSLTINTSSLWPGETPDGSTSGCSTANSQGCLVKVTVSYTFDFFKLFPLQELSNWSISATSEGAILE